MSKLFFSDLKVERCDVAGPREVFPYNGDTSSLLVSQRGHRGHAETASSAARPTVPAGPGELTREGGMQWEVLSRPLRGREPASLPRSPARPQSHLLFEAGVKELPANLRAPDALEASRPGSGMEPVCLSSTWLPGAAPLRPPVTL